MKVLTMPTQVARTLVFGFGAAVAFSGGPSAALAQPVFPFQIREAAPQGFRDRQNSQAWSMIWWKNRLYVGTGRATYCVQQATLQFFRPDLKAYPPKDNDLACTKDPHDLSLQGEIWRWTPGANLWERVYQSPNDVPIQGTTPQKFTAQDIGYRGMTIFTEADGTEALYVSGVSSRGGQGVGFNGPVPPPRILRSTDGTTFEPVPQDLGTFLGDTLVSGFRTLLTYQGKLYVLASVGQLGHGVIFEAEHPEQGNDAFRQISPRDPVSGRDLTFFEIATYNGFLWAGTGVQPSNEDTPFSLLKTDATGDPYTFTTVIPDGAFKNTKPSQAVISLHEFKGRLYVGTDRELLRVNPDDTWDLVVGNPRKTPDGRKLEPLSGFNIGFDNFFNIHMWRIGTHDQCLYVGTQDQTTKWRNNVALGPTLKPRMGADLYASCDGWHYAMISRTGLGDLFNNGWRNFASTPYGLFLGSANHYYGTRIYVGEKCDNPVAAPQRLEVESGLKVVLLSWEGSGTAIRFHVYRDTGFGDPHEIGVTEAPTPAAGRVFVDKVKPIKQYHYFVVAEDAEGRFSDPSNMVRSPFEGPVPTFKSLQALLDGWTAPAVFSELLAGARAAVDAGDYATALTSLAALGQKAADPTLLLAWRGEDLGVLLAKLVRRVTLAQAGVLPPKRLMS